MIYAKTKRQVNCLLIQLWILSSFKRIVGWLVCVRTFDLISGAQERKPNKIRDVLMMLSKPHWNGHIAVSLALSERCKAISDETNNKFQLISLVVEVINAVSCGFRHQNGLNRTSRFNISSEILLFIIITCHYSAHNVKTKLDDSTMKRREKFQRMLLHFHFLSEPIWNRYANDFDWTFIRFGIHWKRIAQCHSAWQFGGLIGDRLTAIYTQ